MTKYFAFSIFFSLLFFSACYTDDSSAPSPNRLPFEDFAEYFEDNNAQADTLNFEGSSELTLTTPSGTKIFIPSDAFAVQGEMSMEIKEAASKSDFILLNKPTVEGSTILESSGALFIKPFTTAGIASMEYPLELEMAMPSGVTVDDMQYYHYQNGWTLDNTTEVLAAANTISFETERSDWQMGGKNLDMSGTATIKVNPAGYGTIPHDMRAFVVLSDRNTVFPLDHNITEVTATGTVPKGIELNIVVMAMDHFTLSIGIKTLVVDENIDIALDMDLVTVNEMISTIKSLD